MTGFDKPVRRRTVGKYRFAVCGAFASPSGKRLVVQLDGDSHHGDWIKIREEKRRIGVMLNVGDLYVKAMRAQAQANRAAKRHAKKRNA